MSKLQLYSVMSVGTLVYVYTYSLNSLIYNSATSGWISSALGCLVWIALIIIASKLIKSTGHKNLPTLIYDYLGEFFGMVVNCLITLAVILSMSERLYECIRLMKLYGYKYTPAVVIAAVIMIVAFYCGKAGHKAVSKTAVPVIFALIGGIIIVVLSGIGQYEFGNLFPLLGHGSIPTIKGSLWTLSAADNILIGLIFADRISAVKFRQSGVAASITTLIVYTVCSLCYSLTFPYSVGQGNSSGIIDIARGTESSGFFQRFEAILLFIVIIGMICFVSIYLSAAVKQVDETFAIKKKRSWILSASLAVVVAVIALIPDYTKISDGNLLHLYRQYSFVFVLVVAIMLIIGSIIKRKVGRKAALVAMMLTITIGMCSCGDYRETENEAYAVMIGIDSVDTEMGYSYSVRLMNESDSIITSVSKSLDAAITDISQKNSRAVSLKSLRILAISEELAKSGITQFIEPIIEDTSTKNSIMLAICSKSAESFISAKRFNNMQEIELTVSNNQRSDMYDPQSINTVYNCIFSTKKDASAAYVINGEDEEEDIISGTALFSSEKMTGFIDGDETALLRAINGKMNAYPLVFDGHEYTVFSKKPAKITVSNDAVEISVFISCTEGGKSIDKLPDNVREVLVKRLNETVADITDAGSDIIGIGQIAARQYSTIENFEQKGWKQKFKALKIKAKLVI